MTSRLSFDPDRTVRDQTCARCGRTYRLVIRLVLRDTDAHAICYAALHHHEGVAEAWMDVIFGTWGEDVADDHVTFGCRVGPVEGRDDPAASLVTAAAAFDDSPMFGAKLTREEALAHPRLQEFWDVVDFVLVEDPEVERHVYR